MAIIPKITNLVEQAVENTIHSSGPARPYLGMSGVGSSCMRKQWYTWRWVLGTNTSIPARKKRIFERGDLEEPRIIADLEAAGMKVTGEQLEVQHETKHCLGHIDGIVENVPGAEKTPHLAEFKTMKASSFNALKKKAYFLDDFSEALLSSHPAYYGQIMLYMGYLGLTRCLYIITNKDTEERIYERIKFVPSSFDGLKERILNILCSEEPPTRVSDRQNWFECKWCDFKDVCFNEQPVQKNCRTCQFADVHNEGKWECSLHNSNLEIENQRAGCNQHKIMQQLGK